MSKRVFLVGWDGASFSILDFLIAKGVMPCFEQLLASGVRSNLTSVIPPLTPPAWTSLMTGRSPGNHGIFDFLRFEHGPDGHQLQVANSEDVACETIWSMVDRSGLRATVLNFPSTFPAPAISGNVVPGWVPWRHLRLACHPKSLYDRLSAIPSFNAKELAMDMALEERALEGCQREEDYEDWIILHTRRERQWFNVLTRLMDEDPSDLTAILFDGVDKLQHVCWRFLDPEFFPDDPSASELRIRNLCFDYFREIDGFLGKIVDRAGSSGNVFVASDHGFGPTVEVFYLNAWLQQNGYLAWVDAAVGEKHPETLGLGTMARRFYEVDWKRTTAYCPTPSSNGIFITPYGEGGTGVAPEDYNEFRQQLKTSLLRFADDSGNPVVSHIWTREEAFAGGKMISAPDLTLSLRDGGLVSILPSNVLVKPRLQPSGAHRPEGIFAASGLGLKRGASVSPQSILDVAPLILHALGLPVPADLEGQVRDDLFEPDYLRSHPVVTASDVAHSPNISGAIEPVSVQMQAEVMQHLRALGYVE